MVDNKLHNRITHLSEFIVTIIVTQDFPSTAALTLDHTEVVRYKCITELIVVIFGTSE